MKGLYGSTRLQRHLKAVTGLDGGQLASVQFSMQSAIRALLVVSYFISPTVGYMAWRQRRKTRASKRNGDVMEQK